MYNQSIIHVQSTPHPRHHFIGTSSRPRSADPFRTATCYSALHLCAYHLGLASLALQKHCARCSHQRGSLHQWNSSDRYQQHPAPCCRSGFPGANKATLAVLAQPGYRDQTEVSLCSCVGCQRSLRSRENVRVEAVCCTWHQV